MVVATVTVVGHFGVLQPVGLMSLPIVWGDLFLASLLCAADLVVVGGVEFHPLVFLPLSVLLFSVVLILVCLLLPLLSILILEHAV